MHDQPTQSPDDGLNSSERDVLYLLTGLRGEQPIWSIPDIAREIESDDNADIATTGLLRAGLIHKTTDGFVFATRAGVRIVQLVGHVA
jgi:hypothetical protein